MPKEGDKASVKGHVGYQGQTYSVYIYTNGEWVLDHKGDLSVASGNEEYDNVAALPKEEVTTDDDSVISPELDDALQDAGIATAGTDTDYGADEISKEDFIKDDGSPRELQEVYNTLDTKLPGITGKDLYDYIREYNEVFDGFNHVNIQRIAALPYFLNKFFIAHSYIVIHSTINIQSLGF